jgi:hypothetical protein
MGETWVYRDRDDFLLFDAGPVGPDHLPAHAHADLLGLEASVDGRRLLVDAGVFDYSEGTMRQYCRGSAAHNVLTIDDLDQCDTWSRFRMGFRGWPSRFDHGESHGFHWARAEHNAYRRCRAPTVGRWIACRPGGPWLSVDWAVGTGGHKITCALHLHPETDVEQIGANELRVRRGGPELRLRFLTAGELRATTGWYCPEFGQRLRCHRIEWTAITTLPMACGWCLAWPGCDGTASLGVWKGEQTVLKWHDRDGEVSLEPVGKT